PAPASGTSAAPQVVLAAGTPAPAPAAPTAPTTVAPSGVAPIGTAPPSGFSSKPVFGNATTGSLPAQVTTNAAGRVAMSSAFTLVAGLVAFILL
ncbi:MAG: hypothetical protein M1832_003412, partial [Thelocarpon impressellum]